jgi:DNA processing protein
VAEGVFHSAGVEHWLALIGADGVGPVTFRRLVDQFGSVEAALGASAGHMARIEGIGPATAERIAASRGRVEVQQELALANRLGVHLIHVDDPRYPSALRTIYDPPPVL